MSHWTKHIAAVILLMAGSVSVWGQGTEQKPSVLDLPSAELRAIVEQQREYYHSGNLTQAQLDQLVARYDAHAKSHPDERPYTLLRLGTLYQTVLPETLRNMELSLQCYRDILPLLSPDDSLNRARVYYRIAITYVKRGDSHMRNVQRYLCDAAKMNPVCTRYLGDMYLFGWGVYQDLFLADQYYSLSMKAGSESAGIFLNLVNYVINQYNLGEYDQEAFGYLERSIYYDNLLQDRGEAEHWIDKACARDLAPALHIKGTFLMERGDKAGARVCFERAAHEDYPLAIYSLALMNDDPDMMRRAAEMHFVPAIRRMGDYYAKGHGTIEKDLVKAVVWYKYGLRMNNGVCRHKLDSIYNVTQFTRDQQTEIESRYESQMQEIMPALDTYIKELASNPRFGHPVLKRGLSPTDSTLTIPEEDPAYTSSIAKAYRTAYDICEALLKTMSLNHGDYYGKQGKNLQWRMKQLRNHAEYLGIYSISPSMWENWDGK